MEKFARAFFSMRMMTAGLFIFLFAIATATFIESAYDIQAARLSVYNAKWFEALLVYLTLSLIANIFRYKMFQREKISILMFHLAFIVMMIGAAITRYVSFEGLMIIKEGQQANFIYSAEPNLWLKINDGKKQLTFNETMYMSEINSNDFEYNFDFPGRKDQIKFEYVDFQKNMIDSLVVNDSIKTNCFELVTNGMQSNFLGEDDFLMVGDVAISYKKDDMMPGVELFMEGPKAMIKTQVPMRKISMAKLRQPGQEVADSMYEVLPVDTLVPFETATLYALSSGEQFVFKGIKKNAKKMLLPSNVKNAGADYLIVKVTEGKNEHTISLKGGKDAIPDHEVFDMNGLVYEMEYGSMKIDLPFAVKCRDFRLDRYPGSNSPSSFESDVTIIDEKNNYTRDQTIFMNNVMDYQGYRFFQSSYEPDESGTRLSVNHDWWGTNISYLGYLMMGIGMLMSLFAPVGRFRELNHMLRKSREKREKLSLVLVAALLLSFNSSASEDTVVDEHAGHNHSHQTENSATRPAFEPTFHVMSEEHSDEVATLLVQDYTGRIVPLHTLADQLLRKLYRSDKYNDYNAVQTIVSMHMHPDYWMNQPVIYVSSKSNLREVVDAKDGYVSFRDLANEDYTFKYLEEYKKAHQTLESQRGEFDKQMIKLAEKFEVAQAIFSWRYMKIIPVKSDPKNTWYSPLNIQLLEIDTSGIKKGIRYLAALDSASSSLGSWEMANKRLDILKDFQYKEAAEIVPSRSAVDMEVRYNKMGVFKNSGYTYFAVGFLALIIFFIAVFVRPSDRSKKYFKRISQVIMVVVGIVFLYHGYGLYMRWVISGHAPWSNSYEAVIFIAWVAILFGLLFARKNAVILAATAILAFLLLFVSEQSLMDPEITPLVPVLKSYWLKIHVAIITGSYAPLGIACMLSILNLLLYIFRTKNNSKIVNLNINELTYVSEMAMTIGVFMLTIGTFLGGVWANESWGRYWGWDPKETWALVAVLAYAVILHLRYIPGLKSKFVFNVVGLWGYATIIFTFFGVNYYLVGLHSYANGEGLGEFPMGLKITIAAFALFTLIAAIRNFQFKKSLNTETTTIDE